MIISAVIDLKIINNKYRKNGSQIN
jgi:hypothetical protein